MQGSVLQACAFEVNACIQYQVLSGFVCSISRDKASELMSMLTQ